MSQALIDTLKAHENVREVSAADLEALIAEGEPLVVFFTGDPEKRVEVADVAVVLRELVRQHANRLRAVLVTREDELTAMRAHGVSALPSLLLIKGGARADSIAKIQDWSVYATKIAALLEDAPPETPSETQTDTSSTNPPVAAE